MMKSALLALSVFASIAVPAVASEAAADRWDMPHAGNPILPGYYADPSVVTYEGRSYVFATLDPWGDKTLGLWESGDFKNWNFRALIWPTKLACTSATSKGSMVWAPSVVQGKDGRFYMYVSVGSEVWVGVAQRPIGPWKNALDARPLIPAGFNKAYHMIDAECFIDDDGSAYLYWGSGWNWTNGRCFVVKLKDDMVTFDGEPRDVTPENYFEGPFMVKNAGRYFLTYSQGKTTADTYQVHYAVGDSPMGPFKEAANSPILTTDKARNVVSPGHHAIFKKDGRAYIAYHRHSVPYVEGKALRQTCVDALVFTADGLIEKVVPTHRGPALVQREQPRGLLAVSGVSASSSLDVMHSPAAVLDDNYATHWVAAADAVGGWLQLDLGAVKKLKQSHLRPEFAWKSSYFAFEISADGKDWKMVADYRLSGGIGGSPIMIQHPLEARYLRMVFPETVKGTDMSIIEWQVF